MDELKTSASTWHTYGAEYFSIVALMLSLLIELPFGKSALYGADDILHSDML